VSLAFAPADDPASFGHHFLLGLQKSPLLTDRDKRLLEALRPAGVVLFRDNFAHELPYPEWLDLHARQLWEVRECVEREELLVTIDHEGGSVLRTPEPITHFAAAAQWAPQAESVGRAMGRELRSLGVNVDFAPVVDVDSNPDNPVIGKRALGRDPRTVIEAAASFLEGLEAEGVAGCLKHFPGHGDTHADSHDELPVVDLDLDVLEARELAPFAALVERGARMIMTAHILFPRWDPKWPATLSETIVGEYLRGKLGYDGLVISDDVGMQAIAERFREPGMAARALVAGCDLITICAHLADTRRALDLARDLSASWRGGGLPAATLERSHGRIARALAAAPVYPVTELPAETLALHRSLAPLAT
jgi:beta-N-acetylhexosaminidase